MQKLVFMSVVGVFSVGLVFMGVKQWHSHQAAQAQLDISGVPANFEPAESADSGEPENTVGAV